MAGQWGGARVPSAPAQVSGPGALSARTDGNQLAQLAGGGEYGGTRAFEQMQQQAPVGAQPGPAGPGVPEQGFNPLEGIVGLSVPGSETGDVTAGADSLLAEQSPREQDQADVARLHPGMVQAMLAQAMRADATPSFRRLVRDLVATGGY